MLAKFSFETIPASNKSIAITALFVSIRYNLELMESKTISPVPLPFTFTPKGPISASSCSPSVISKT